MTLTVIAARLRQAALNIEALPPEDREADIPHQLVAQLVMNSFVDDTLVEAFRILRIREERRSGRPNQPVPPAALPHLRFAADYPEDLSSSSSAAFRSRTPMSTDSARLAGSGWCGAEPYQRRTGTVEQARYKSR
jgi:hypothetical protein